MCERVITVVMSVGLSVCPSICLFVCLSRSDFRDYWQLTVDFDMN